MPSVTGGPVPAYMSVGGSKAVLRPVPTGAASSQRRRLSEIFPGQRPFQRFCPHMIARPPDVVKRGAVVCALFRLVKTSKTGGIWQARKVGKIR